MKNIETKIVLASSNPGKLKEFQILLNNCGFDVLPQSNFATPDVDETGLTFVENAILKARNACKYSGLPALADDSGIEVDALKGAPGIYSARFSGEGATDTHNNEKLLRELKGLPKEERSARYQCLLVYMQHADDPTPIICQGAWEGFILEGPVGENGFGYDPLFFVPSHNCRSAQLSKEIKNSISHRAIAMQNLLAKLKN
jgi:XTP/dITP diphosphohydrolase